MGTAQSDQKELTDGRKFKAIAYEMGIQESCRVDSNISKKKVVLRVTTGDWFCAAAGGT